VTLAKEQNLLIHIRLQYLFPLSSVWKMCPHPGMNFGSLVSHSKASRINITKMSTSAYLHDRQDGIVVSQGSTHSRVNFHTNLRTCTYVCIWPRTVSYSIIKAAMIYRTHGCAGTCTCTMQSIKLVPYSAH
jgi:hypothetical protein